MRLIITLAAMRAAFSHAKPGACEAFVAKQSVLDLAEVTLNARRLSFYLAQLHHESGGMTIVAENLNYTAKRMTEVWPKRFPTIAAAQPYADNPRALANKTYGGRMGNRPGTDDGYDYRGRGFIQITGRDGYAEVGKRCGLDLINNPNMAGDINLQPEITTGFWTWKGLNPVCDTGDLVKVTKLINGGTTGLDDRQAALERIRPIVDRMETASATGAPPSPIAAAKRGTVTAAGLNLRARPNVSETIVEVLPRDAAVEIIGETMAGATQWFNVKAPSGKSGWVAAKYVAVT